MELTKLVRQITVTAFAIAILGGCSKQDGATPITTGRDGRISTPGGSAVSSAGIQLNGWVISSGNQDLFQEAVGGLVDATMPADYLGFVSADAKGGTGLFLGGRVELQSGALNPNSTARVNVRADSKLLLAVYDEFTGRADASGTVVKPISIGFSRAEGYVSGNQVSLKFIDPQYGFVVMQGSFSGSLFRGSISYDNAVRYDGSRPGAAGTLGDFEVPTCQFFRCQ